MTKHIQTAIIGAGPGGYVAALRLAQRGIATALIERDEVGGTCLHRGCIPTKALIQSAAVSERIKQAGPLGIQCGEVILNMPQAQTRSRAIVEKMRKGVEFLLAKRGVQLIKGHAEFRDEHRLRVNHEDLTFDHAIIAVGSQPAELRHIKPDPQAGILTSDDLLRRQTFPASLLIIGGGVIGCEFAYLCSAFGTRVTVVELTERLIPQEDPDAARFLTATLTKRGVTVVTKTTVEDLQQEGGGWRCRLSSGDEPQVEAVLLAVGRTSLAEACGAARLGLLGQHGIIDVNEYMQTRHAHIYAVGDVTGAWWLAHVASAQGKTAADAIAGQKRAMDYQAIPRCIYTHPEIASVGLTQTQAKERNMSVRVGTFPFSALGKAVIDQEPHGMVKIVCRSDNDRIIGALVCGQGATEMISELTLAVAAHMTSERLAAVVHAHPTLSEAVMEAAESVRGTATHAG